MLSRGASTELSCVIRFPPFRLTGVAAHFCARTEPASGSLTAGEKRRTFARLAWQPLSELSHFPLAAIPFYDMHSCSTPPCIEVNGVEECSEHGGGTVLCAQCIRDSGQSSPQSFTETSLACTTEKLSDRKGFS